MASGDFEEFHRCVDNGSLCLTHGDFWPNAIHVGQYLCTADEELIDRGIAVFPSVANIPIGETPGNTQGNRSHRELVILDWEFCKFDHPLNDYFNLLAYLLLMQFDTRYNQDNVLNFKRQLLDCIQRRIHEEAAYSLKLPITEDSLCNLLVNVALHLSNSNDFDFDGKTIDAADEIARVVEAIASEEGINCL